MVVATDASAVPFTVTGVVRAAPPVKVASPDTLIVEATVTGAEKLAEAGTVSAWPLLAPN